MGAAQQTAAEMEKMNALEQKSPNKPLRLSKRAVLEVSYAPSFAIATDTFAGMFTVSHHSLLLFFSPPRNLSGGLEVCKYLLIDSRYENSFLGSI